MCTQVFSLWCHRACMHAFGLVFITDTSAHRCPIAHSNSSTCWSNHTHTHTYRALRLQDMASPGLKPGPFFLALVTAKPAEGHGAARCCNRTGPVFGFRKYRSAHWTFFCPSSFVKCWNRTGHSTNVQVEHEAEGHCITAQGCPDCPVFILLSVGRG